MHRSLLAAALAASVAAQATDCGAAKGATGTFSRLVLTPAIPVAGNPFNLYGTGTINEAVTGGTGDINVLYLGVALFQGSFTTCGNTSVALPLNVGTLGVDSLVCPTVAGKAGGMAINLTVSIPTGVPPGAYEVQLTANDQASKLAFCADIQFSLDASTEAAPAAGRASLRGAVVDAAVAAREEAEEEAQQAAAATA